MKKSMLPIESLNKQLKELIGLKFTATSRAADMECLKFGDLIEDGYHEYALHLQCYWRFTAGGKVVVGSSDLYGADPKLRDGKLQELIARKPKIVSAVADDFGGFEINFESGLQFSIFANQSEPYDDMDEYWRLLQNKTKKQLVMSASGMEEI